MLSVSLDEAILINIHSIQFHDKIRKFPLIFFLELSEEFRRDSKMSSS